jgi:hypothetical protein
MLLTTRSHLLITGMSPAILILIPELLDADDLKPPDVGIDSSMPCFKHAGSKGPPRVTYLHFYDCSKFSVILQILHAFFPTITTTKKGSLLNRCFFCMVSAVWHILFTQISRHSAPQPSWDDRLQQDPFWFHALEVV